MTGTDLRAALADDLQDVDPMTTVVPHVLTEGRRRERRRRSISVALTAVAVAGVISLPIGVPDILKPDTPTPATDRPHTQTRAEFGRWAANELSAILPERFADVQPRGGFAYVTHLDGTRLFFTITISHRARGEEHDVVPPCEEFSDNESCAEDPGIDAIAHHSSTYSAYAQLQMGADGDVADEVAMEFFAPRKVGAFPLSDQEILDLARSPQFERVWREVDVHPKWVRAGTMGFHVAPDDSSL